MEAGLRCAYTPGVGAIAGEVVGYFSQGPYPLCLCGGLLRVPWKETPPGDAAVPLQAPAFGYTGTDGLRVIFKEGEVKQRLLWLVLCVLLAGLSGIHPAPAAAEQLLPGSPAGADISLPISYITHPCLAYQVTPPEQGPMVASCLSPINTAASIQLPLPQLVDQRPERNLVTIPTYFSYGWDEGSLHFEDGAGRDIAWPVHAPTDQLVQVRLQLRLRLHDFSTLTGIDHPVQVIVRTPSPRWVRLFLVGGSGPWELVGPDADLACNPGIVGAPGADPQVNTLLMVPEEWGGFNADIHPQKQEETDENLGGSPGFTLEPAGDPCKTYLLARLGRGEILLPFGEPADPAAPASRYLDLTGATAVLHPGTFVVWTPFAEEVSVSVHTLAVLEARLIWSDHQVKVIRRDWDCRWEYRERYDRLDWGRWPEPIYCREVLREVWVSQCQPEAAVCEGELYGRGESETWWQPVAILSGEGLRLATGVHAPQLAVPVSEAEAFLTAP